MDQCPLQLPGAEIIENVIQVVSKMNHQCKKHQTKMKIHTPLKQGAGLANNEELLGIIKEYVNKSTIVMECLEIIKKNVTSQNSDGRKEAQAQQLPVKCNECQELRSEIKKLKTDLSALQKDKEAQVNQMKNDNETMHRELQKMNQLQNENERMSSELERIAQTKNENEKLESPGGVKNKNANNININLVVNTNSSKGENNTQYSELEDLRHEEQLKEREQQLFQFRDESEKQRKKLEDEISLLNARNKERIQKLETEKQELHSKFDKLTKDVSNTSAKERQDREVINLKETQIKELEEKFKLDIKEKEEHINRINSGELKQLKEKLSEITKDLESKDTLLQQKEKQLNETKQELSKLDKLSKITKQLESKDTLLQQKEKQLNETKQELSKLKNIISNKTEEMPKIQGKNKESEDDVGILRRQVQELTDRLANEMSEKISKDESALENVSIMCRPMNIASEYELLCSNSWLEAKNCMSEEPEKEACTFLKDILIISSETASKMFDEIVQFIQAILAEPVVMKRELLDENMKKDDYKAIISKKSGKQLPDAIISYIGDSFRQVAAESDLEYLVKLTRQSLEKKHNSLAEKHLKTKAVEIYIKEACTLGWKMAIQRPKMVFSEDNKGKKWTTALEETHEIHWGSDPSKSNAVIQYYVHPILKHGAKVMSKGKVYINV